jgi:tetratricopeptide (TPR) repeat protein
VTTPRTIIRHLLGNERLNTRFLARALVTIVVVGIGWFGLHAFQMRQHRRTLLDLANRAEEQGKVGRAVDLLYQYMTLSPEDVDAQAHFGVLVEESDPTVGGRRMAADVYEQVLIRAPERHDIRRRLAKLAFRLEDFDLATAHVQALRDSFPKDAQLTELLAQCHEARGEYKEAVDFYRQAIRQDTTFMKCYVHLALLLVRRLNRPLQEADELMDALVMANDRSYQAYLERACYRREFKSTKVAPAERAAELAQADADAAAARRLAPEEAGPLLVSAELAQERGEVKVAREYLEQAIRSHPKDPALYEALARLETGAKRPHEAVACLRRGLEQLPGQKSILFTLAGLLIQIGDLQEAQSVINQLVEQKAPVVYTQNLKARLEFQRGDWFRAAGTLEALQPHFPDAPELAGDCFFLLGKCYEQMGAVDRQLAVYRRANKVDPFSVPVRLGTTTALLRLGRIGEAIEEAQSLMQFPNAPALGFVLLARLMVLQNLSATNPQWQPVEDALERAEKLNPDVPDIPILRAEVLVAQKKPDVAWQLLDKARRRKPKEVELWVALVDLALHENKLDSAKALLDDVARELGDGVELRLARARYLLKRGDRVEAEALTRLADGLERFGQNERARILRGLAESCAQADKLQEAQRLWNRLAELRPEELQVRLALFDAAMRSDDEEAMLTQLQAIRRIEGRSGSQGHLGAALHLVWQARKRNKGLNSELLAEARRELMEAEAAAHQPARATIPLVRAEIALLEDNEDVAIKEFLSALDLGSRQLRVVEPLLKLLYKHQRYHDVEAVLSKLPARTPMSAEMQRLITDIRFQTGDYNGAVAAARSAVAANSARDYRDYLWLGQILWISGRSDEAEPVLRQAVQMKPDAPVPWVVLVQYLARKNRLKDAETVLHEAEGALAKGKATLALALCYEAIGRQKEAAKLYEAAVATEQNRAATRQSASDFYLRVGDWPKAQHQLEQILKLKDAPLESVLAARRVLSRLYAAQGARGDYQKSRQALELLKLRDGDSPPPESAALEDLRTEAVVLASQRTRGHKLQAIDLLLRLGRSRPLDPEDQYLLVQLYEAVGEAAKARAQMLRLLSVQGNEPRNLVHHVRVLLRQGQHSDAQLWLDRLDKVAPRLFETVELRARWLKARGKDADIDPLVAAYLQQNPATPLVGIAALLENLGLVVRAEELYRRFARDSKQPQSVLTLAQFLGRQKRTEEALALCEAAWSTCPPVEVASTCISILRAAPSSSDDRRLRVRHRLEMVLREKPDAVGVMLWLAELNVLSGRYREAEALYRQLLARDARNSRALNNLAWLLIFDSRQGEEAVRLANSTIELSGPLPQLLDTRACAYLLTGQTALAIADLRNALSEATTGGQGTATMQFHLAQALQRSGEKTAAQAALAQAQADGLEQKKLHPLEQVAFRQIVADLAKR